MLMQIMLMSVAALSKASLCSACFYSDHSAATAAWCGSGRSGVNENQ